jgi:sec-independent protein translocase protein TatB
MLPPMFGIGGSEMLVILIVALLFLGPEKLPDAASKISKGIRDLRKQTRDLTNTIENDTEIGGAIRDLKSALRGEDFKVTPKPPRPKLTSVPDPELVSAPAKKKKKKKVAPEAVAEGAVAVAAIAASEPQLEVAEAVAVEAQAAEAPVEEAPAVPLFRMPETAGEAGDVAEPATDDDEDLAKLVRKPAGIVAKGDGDDDQKAG